MVRTASGATIHIESSWAAYGSATDEFGVSLMGDKGGAEIRVKDYQKPAALPSSTMWTVFQRIRSREPLSSMNNSIVEQFLNSIIDGVPMSPSGEEGVNRARVIDLIYQSSQRSREITIGQPRKCSGRLGERHVTFASPSGMNFDTRRPMPRCRRFIPMACMRPSPPAWGDSAFEVRTATLDEPEHGLTQEVLD